MVADERVLVALEEAGVVTAGDEVRVREELASFALSRFGASGSMSISGRASRG